MSICRPPSRSGSSSRSSPQSDSDKQTPPPSSTHAGRQSPDLSHLALDSSPTGGLLLTAEPAPLDGPVLAQLQAVTARQNERDTVHDAADPRQLMRTALQANSDVEMIRVLQVGRDEMPEAIKTLQRALEKEVERERTLVEQEEAVFVTSTATSATVSTSSASPATKGQQPAQR